MPTLTTRIELPEKLRFLFSPARYKVAYGGRGGAKSWAFARALLVLGMQRKMRILCAREIQKSIRESVHKLLSDQITQLGLGDFYEVLQAEIRGSNGTEFLFSGLAEHTAHTIKSFEGVDICWIEEAQAVSKRSWDILAPTIRSAGSEIWISMNPELDTDETYARFIADPPDGAIVVKVNYDDNPWFTEELEFERALCAKMRPGDYNNIWKGEPRVAVEGAIYAQEITRAQEDKRIREVPYDPMVKVHAVCDLGFNDSMAIILVQRVTSELRIIDYIEDRCRTLDDYSSQLRDRRYNFGQIYLPHDAQHKTLASGGRSTEQIMRALGWDVRMVPNIDVESGIMQARMAFPRCYFDKVRASRLVECLKRYRRNIPKTTGEPSSPMHDEFSHGADAFRYLSLIADELQTSGQQMRPIRYQPLGMA